MPRVREFLHAICHVAKSDQSGDTDAAASFVYQTIDKAFLHTKYILMF